MPVWAASRSFLGPIFVSTAAATGASATRLVARRRRAAATTTRRGDALERVEAAAMVVESALAQVNEHRLGRLAEGLHQGRPGRLFGAAHALVYAGLATRAARGPLRAAAEPARHAGSVCFLAAGLCFRYAWVGAGPPSARDDEAVALMARARGRRGDPDPDPGPTEAAGPG